MKPAPFSYHAPASLDEATVLLEKLGREHEDVKILAGGQSLVPTMALRLARPAHLIDINGIARLDGVASDERTLRIGATVRHARFHDAQGLGGLGPVLTRVAGHIAHYPIRQRGTFCGSLAHADPASEWCLAAATFDAIMTATSTNGSRQIDALDYFQGIMTTALEQNEILTEATLQQIGPDTKWGFEEFSMRAGDFAVAMALVAFDLDGGTIANARVGIGGIEPFPRRIADAESILNGKRPGEELFLAAGKSVSETVDPLDDWQASGPDRCAIASALVKRTLAKALGEKA